MYMVMILLIVGYNHCLTASNRFVRNNQNKIDILDQYFEFKASYVAKVDDMLISSGIRSSTQCLAKCVQSLSNRCISISFSKTNGTCRMFANPSWMKGSYPNLYKRRPKCPGQFTYLKQYDKCYGVVPGKWNWNEARSQCNAIDSHVIVIDDDLELQALRNFANMKGLQPSCSEDHQFLWTAGSQVNNKQLPFVWKPFRLKNGMEPYVPITFNKWSPGNPDNALSVEFCINLMATFEYNDFDCEAKVCVVCEIDV